jgi:transcription elongation factor GreB
MANVPTEKPPKRETKNYITPAGFRRLQSEFEELRLRTRREVVQKLSEAAAEGDRSENAEYIYRKKQLYAIDRRIRFLLKRMSLAEVIDPSLHRGNRVLFGAVVFVEDDSGKSTRYQIVGEDESAPRDGLISWSSPIGRSLVGKRIGDVVTVRLAQGEREMSIEGLEFPGTEIKEGSAAIAAAQAEAKAALESSAEDLGAEDLGDDEGDNVDSGVKNDNADEVRANVVSTRNHV